MIIWAADFTGIPRIHEWRVPHFEKMLYDQALLLMAFTEAWLATKKPLYKKTAEAIIAYVTRDLSSPEGAFISAEDADSAGGEGAFYLWTTKETGRRARAIVTVPMPPL